MLTRMSRLGVTNFAGALALAGALLAPQTTCRADASTPVVPPARAAAASRAAKVKQATPPSPARARRADTSSLYACHPGEDLACTVIHETPRGVVVVTFLPKNAKSAPDWSVVNAPAEPNAGSSGGTIYIVPNGGQQLTSVQATANGSPIID